MLSYISHPVERGKMSRIDLQFSLEEAYRRDSGRTFLSGIQALVRLPMVQRRLDRRAGLNTAGLVSGYRGSPLGAYDQQLWRASKLLEAHDIVFQPGLNEDLAATALWGAQMHKAYGPTRADGVFGVWYGKGPGVDRTGDVFRNANMLGTSSLGGVLAVAGDDHAAQSSMFPHQTDGIFHSVSIPVIQPSTIPEVLSLGLAGFALSRFSGLWVGMKTIAEVVESAGSFDLPDPYPAFIAPADFAVPAHGLNWDPTIAWPAQRGELERRLIEERLPAALAWVRANRLDRKICGGGGGLGLVTVGKAHQDLMQALSDLGLDEGRLKSLGVGVYKVAMSWPLETEGLRAFAEGRPELLVIEEKRNMVEAQIRDAFYHAPVDRRPRVIGKRNEAGAPLLPEISEFNPLMVARVVAERLLRLTEVEGLASRMRVLESRISAPYAAPFPARKPYFCSGCPHNTSTVTPEGSIAGGGVGCHIMALSLPERKTSIFSQMGGEGAQWIGAAPFSERGHIFQNLGDGTYQHSGLLAIRAAVAAKTNVTFKILYNDAVAMTGGQSAEGAIDPARISRQLAAEGVERIALLSDAAERWAGSAALADGVKVYERSELDIVQRELREVPGVTALIYEQTCAAEKRRRRKKRDASDPPKRLFINPRVCEGCGDCSVQSNCIAVEPLETEFGRKRKINQNACNKDFSCVKGFCPSFVEIDGPALRKPDADRLKTFEAERFAALPAAKRASLEGVYNIYIAGIGGTGILTIGALLGLAAHLEGIAATVLDFTGLAQKNGAVVSQVRLAKTSEAISAVRVGPAETDLLLATDMLVAAQPDALSRFGRDRTQAVMNLDETPTGDFVRQRDMVLPGQGMQAAIRNRLAGDGLSLHASQIAKSLFGDTVATNVMMLGAAWQRGLVPLSAEAILRAIELNGAAVELNTRAFVGGRLAALDLAEVARMAGLVAARVDAPPTLDALIALRAEDLTAYQDPAYARRYRDLVENARVAGRGSDDRQERFARAVAETAYRLMAYKDEYEVARLYTAPELKEALDGQFSSRERMSVWLSPPILSRIDPATGRPAKRKFGPWVFTLFGLLARLKGLRGTAFDPFGRTAERRMERRLIADYEALVRELSASLTPARLMGSVNLAVAPSAIRGFGPVKKAAVAAVEARMAQLRRALDDALALQQVA
jgi:indolepyruvate ferredoxin oxidoreductase